MYGPPAGTRAASKVCTRWPESCKWLDGHFGGRIFGARLSFHGVASGGLLVAANSDVAIGGGHVGGGYTRQARTTVLRSNNVVIHIEYNAVADHRTLGGSCFLYGTATLAV